MSDLCLADDQPEGQGGENRLEWRASADGRRCLYLGAESDQIVLRDADGNTVTLPPGAELNLSDVFSVENGQLNLHIAGTEGCSPVDNQFGEPNLAEIRTRAAGGRELFVRRPYVENLVITRPDAYIVGTGTVPIEIVVPLRNVHDAATSALCASMYHDYDSGGIVLSRSGIYTVACSARAVDENNGGNPGLQRWQVRPLINGIQNGGVGAFPAGTTQNIETGGADHIGDLDFGVNASSSWTGRLEDGDLIQLAVMNKGAGAGNIITDLALLSVTFHGPAAAEVS